MFRSTRPARVMICIALFSARFAFHQMAPRAMWCAFAALFVAVVLAMVPSVVASSGDQNNAIFRRCQMACQAECDAGNAAELSLVLRATFWTCREECNYQCMWKATDEH